MMLAIFPESLPELDAAHERARSLWEPPPDISVSDWAEANVYLRKGSTPRPGPLVLEKYQREMLDVFADPLVHEVVCVKPTQIGWTVILYIIAGFTVDVNPQPLMIVQPTADNAEDFGRKRLNPFIEDCPALKAKVRAAKSRDGANTLKLKTFPGGFIKLAGANAGTDLRSDPVPIVLMDEVEAYPDDVNGEGDPMEIAANRTESFPDFKILKGSTPAKGKGDSRLEDAWKISDQRRFFVPCPFCGHEQVLWWRDPITDEYRVVFEVNEKTGEVRPESVRFVCSSCKRGISERYKKQMLDRGRWIAEHPERSVVGFWLNALYRPWKESWAALCQKWVAAQEDKEKLKEFVTLQLAEFWEERGSSRDAGGLKARLEPYPKAPGMPPDHPRPWEWELVPNGVGVLTMTVDVQENRLEAKVKGWGAGEESWLLAHEVFWGDPGADQHVWEELERFRLREFTHESGRKLRIMLTLVDSGDQSDAVYDFVEPRQNLRDRVFALKGVDQHTKPLLVQEGTTKRSHVRLYTVATFAAKERILARMGIPQPGPGYMHLPDWTTDEYLSQLTGEKKVTTRDKRTKARKVKWVKTHTRNEALDLEVYQLAAIFILQKFIDPRTFGDLGALAAAIRGEAALPVRAQARRIRSRGVE